MREETREKLEDIGSKATFFVLMGIVLLGVGALGWGIFAGTPGPSGASVCVLDATAIQVTQEFCDPPDYSCGTVYSKYRVGERGAPFEEFTALVPQGTQWVATYRHRITGEVAEVTLSACSKN